MFRYQTALGGKFNDWAKVTPRHNAFIDTIISSNMHIISTARTKIDYALEDGFNKSGGKTTKPVKVGLKTEQREGLDYEFTIVFRLNENNFASAAKDRTSLFNGLDEKISEETGYRLFDWLNQGLEIKEENKSESEHIDPDFDLIEGAKACKSYEEFSNYYKENFPKAKNRTAFNAVAMKIKAKLSTKE